MINLNEGDKVLLNIGKGNHVFECKAEGEAMQVRVLDTNEQPVNMSQDPKSSNCVEVYPKRPVSEPVVDEEDDSSDAAAE